MTASLKIPLLLVDDTPESLASLERILKEMDIDFELVKASSGSEAVKQTLKHEFALIILDVQMPDLNGIETAELLRTNPKTRHIPIIFISAAISNNVDLFKGYELGAVDYIVKPIESVVLKSKVNVFSELYSMRKKLEEQNSLLACRIDEQTREVSSLSLILSETAIEHSRTQEELYQSDLRMRSVIESAYEAFICMDDKGTIFDWNQQATALFGWERIEVISHQFVDIFVPVRNREAHLQEQNNFVANSKNKAVNKRYEFKAQHRDGHEFPVEMSIWRISGTSEELFGAFFRDITEQKNAETAMLKLNEQLEERVATRTRELQQSREKVVDSERLASLGSLVAGVAHEMNTPIGNCVSLASTLQEQARSFAANMGLNKVRRSDMEKFLTDIENGNEILVRNLARAAMLVQSFKQVAVDQTSNQRRRFDLQRVLEQDVVTIGPMYKKTPFKMNLVLTPGIVMDSFPGPLGQIITNFVSNSLMHGFHGRDQGMMFLGTRLISEDVVEINYADDGNGIDEKNIHHVFDPFFTTRLGQGGSGLGLSIVHNLVVSVLGGSISIQSTKGAGTKFSIKLPVIAPELSK